MNTYPWWHYLLTTSLWTVVAALLAGYLAYRVARYSFAKNRQMNMEEYRIRIHNCLASYYSNSN